MAAPKKKMTEKDKVIIDYVDACSMMDNAKSTFKKADDAMRIIFGEMIKAAPANTEIIIHDTKHSILIVDKGNVGNMLDKDILVNNIVNTFKCDVEFAKKLVKGSTKPRAPNTTVRGGKK